MLTFLLVLRKKLMGQIKLFSTREQNATLIEPLQIKTAQKLSLKKFSYLKIIKLLCVGTIRP